MKPTTETKPPLTYVVTALCYKGHYRTIATRPDAEPVAQVVNMLLHPGEKYEQCGREDCQCAVPQISTALQPADEATRKAVAEHRLKMDATRRAGATTASLQARITELELQTRILELEAQLAAKKGKN